MSNKTGTVRGQIKNLDARLKKLGEHVVENPADTFSERSFMKLVGRRNRLIGYANRRI